MWLVKKHRTWSGYVIAIMLVALDTWLKQLALPDIIPANVPILYFLAIVPVALFFGIIPSIFTCLLSMFVFDYFFIPPLHTIVGMSIGNESVLAAIFLLVGITISYMASSVRKQNNLAAEEIRQRKQAEIELLAYKERLEDLVTARTQELKEANALLEDDKKIKDDFISMVSHELKTPLTVVIGDIKVALAPGIEREQVLELLHDADTASEEMQNYLDNLLQLSRHRVGKLAVTPRATDVRRLLDASLSKVKNLSAVHNFSLEAPDDLPPLSIDENKIKQVLYNLLTNAIKYSPEGTCITVTACKEDSALAISVSDQGKGMSPEELQKLFQPFERLGEGRGNKPGMGIGLITSRYLVEAHGGKIWMKSEEGRGSTFFFSLPLTNS